MHPRLTGPRGAWHRAAPAIAAGVLVACLVLLAFVPSVIRLYESRGSPPVSVDASLLGLVALVANLVVLLLFALAGRRAR